MKLEEDFISEVKKYDKVIIYGAGVVAQHTYRWFETKKLDKKIKAFAVTYKGDNPDDIEKIPVLSIAELGESEKRDLVIIATMENAHAEIIMELKNRGFMYLLPISNNLRLEMERRIQIDKKKKLYICEGYYHVLITLVKILTNEEKADIMLTNGVDKNYGIQFRIMREKIVDNIICFNKGKVEDVVCKNKLFERLFGRNKLVKNFEKEFMIECKRYKGGIYLYFDNDKIAKYLQAKKCNYHLIEDSFDFMKNVLAFKYGEIVKYWSTYKYKIDQLFDLEYQPFGQSRYCKTIEVNDLEGVVCSKRKTYELPREKLFGKLKEKHKDIILRVFAGDIKLEIDKGLKSILVITQPLFKDGFVPSLQSQVAIYTYILKELCKEYDIIYLKAHPRDDYPYESMEMNMTIIDKNIPTEIFNFKNEKLFDTAITINSTAICSMNFVDEKRVLGIEFLAKFISEKERDNLLIKI